jgi:hypothetical protein
MEKTQLDAKLKCQNKGGSAVAECKYTLLLRNLYSSPSIVIIIKSRRLRWAGHVARMGEKRNACRLFVGKP